jgi:hypothetical protein
VGQPFILLDGFRRHGTPRGRPRDPQPGERRTREKRSSNSPMVHDWHPRPISAWESSKLIGAGNSASPGRQPLCSFIRSR